MASRITKFPIATLPFTTALISYPSNAVDMMFGVIDSNIVLWALVETTVPVSSRLRYFEMHLTGDTIDSKTRQLVLTVVSGIFEVHVFEIVTPH